MLRVREVHHGDTTLVPGLHFDVPARNWNERPIVGYTVFAVCLGSRHLVVAREFQLVILEVEHRISTPLVRIVCATARAKSAAPLISEHDLGSIVRKGR